MTKPIDDPAQEPAAEDDDQEERLAQALLDIVVAAIYDALAAGESTGPELEETLIADGHMSSDPRLAQVRRRRISKALETLTLNGFAHRSDEGRYTRADLERSR